MGTCYIVGAGECAPLPEIREGDFVIAADGGFDSLAKQKIAPNLLVGDLDSIGNVPTGIEILRFNAKKDETDMHLALLAGARRGYKIFEIHGGTGGRCDHTFANYSLLYYAAKNGYEARLVGESDKSFVLVNGKIRLPEAPVGKYFSVFAFGGEARGVTIKNAAYEVENVKLTPDFPLGVSNRFCDTPPTVSVENGALLIIFQK